MKQVTIDPSFWELFPDAQVNILFANGIDNHDTDNNYDERKKLLANPSFWELFPDAQVNILFANGIDNHDTDNNYDERKKLLANATHEADKFLTNETFRLNPVVDQWRQAFQQFKKKKGARSSIENGIDNHDTDNNYDERKKLLANATHEADKFLTNETFRLNPVVDQWRQAFQQFKKKKGARSSIEALLKRANQGRKFEPIEPLVDVYNSISLSYGVPVGIEDRNKIAGDLHLGVAKGGEAFRPVGAEEDEPALEGEVIYYDDEGAVCRCLNWREAQRTMLTEDSQNVVAVMEAINPEQIERANEAMEELSKLA